MEGMEKGVTRALQSVGRLEQAAAKGREEKPSVRAELKTAKQQEPRKQPPARQKRKEASL